MGNEISEEERCNVRPRRGSTDQIRIAVVARTLGHRDGDVFGWRGRGRRAC